MTGKRFLLTASAAALASGPAWTLPSAAGAAPSNCRPLTIAYSALGTLLDRELLKNDESGRYDGEVTVRFRNPRGGSKVVTFTLEGTRVSFDVPDRNRNGALGSGDLRAGDLVRLKGTIVSRVPECGENEHVTTTRIRTIAFTAP